MQVIACGVQCFVSKAACSTVCSGSPPRECYHVHSADVCPAAMQSLLDHGRGGLTRVYCNNPYDHQHVRHRQVPGAMESKGCAKTRDSATHTLRAQRDAVTLQNSWV